MNLKVIQNALAYDACAIEMNDFPCLIESTYSERTRYGAFVISSPSKLTRPRTSIADNPSISIECQRFPVPSFAPSGSFNHLSTQLPAQNKGQNLFIQGEQGNITDVVATFPGHDLQDLACNLVSKHDTDKTHRAR